MKRYMKCLVGVLCLGLVACGGGDGEPALPDVSNDVVETISSDQVEVVADTTAPTAPSQLQATADGLTAVNLTWVGSTDDVGVTGYKVFDKDAEIGTSTTTTFRHDGLVAGSEHCYRIRAFDLAGNVSDPCNEACVTLTETESPTISGTIQYTGTQTGTIVVLLIPMPWTEEFSKDDVVVGATLLAPGPYTTTELPDGTYYLFSFMLTEGGTSIDDAVVLKTDPWAAYEALDNPTAVVIADGKPVTDVDMVLVDGTTDSPNPFADNNGNDDSSAMVNAHHWSGGYDLVLSWQFGNFERNGRSGVWSRYRWLHEPGLQCIGYVVEQLVVNVRERRDFRSVPYYVACHLYLHNRAWFRRHGDGYGTTRLFHDQFCDRSPAVRGHHQ